jgi:murein DD-endopeptidase MepM/ murein hydrolase activator NlpD
LANISTYCSGVEIATEKNSKARSVFEGEVLKIQKIKGANNAIYIQHGNYITIYQNVVNIKVKRGDKVSTKQEIGTVFTNAGTGRTVLKFLVYQNDKKMNPSDWVFRM